MGQFELEDFADFYLTGVHRGDDAFALMEQHHIAVWCSTRRLRHRPAADR